MARTTANTARTETLARWAAIDAAYLEVEAEFRAEFLPFRDAWTGDLIVDEAFQARVTAKLRAAGITPTA